MELRQLKLGPMENFVYLFARGGEAFVVDPAWDVARILRPRTLEEFERFMREP